MKLIVHDASILIDLTVSEAVDAWFATRIETWTTDLIYPREVERPEQRRPLDAYVAAGKLQIRRTTETVEELIAARARLGLGLSLPDVSALLLTQAMGTRAVLATGDALLRKTAEREKLKACGILGLFDLMTAPATGCAVLPYPVAAEKLARLLAHPECRLPRKICLAKIDEWKTKSR